MSVDFSSIAAETSIDEQGTVLELKHRDEEPWLDSQGQQATFTILGPYSKKVKAAEHANTKRFVKQMRGQFDAKESEQGAIRRAAAAVIAWSGIECEGQPVPFSPENVLALLQAAPFLVEQINIALGDYAGFFKGKSAA